MAPARISPWRRMRRSRVPSNGPGRFFASQFSAGYTTNMSGFDFRQAQPSQGWRTFLSNHVDGIAAIDLFVLPTIAFQMLYCLVIVRHGRRLWVSFGVTANPTAEWISRQVTEAFPWDHAPRYLIRDRDT